MERGYLLELVDENLMRGAALDREDLLRPKFYPSQATPAVLSKPKFVPTFIITFNPHNPPLKDWLNETFLILQANSKMKKIYDRPPSVTFRQARNLKQVLVRSRLRELPFSNCSDVPEPGCYKFNHGNRGRGCLLCPKLNVSNRFKSSFTGLSYNIRHHFHCKSSYVVYLVTCQACSSQYVGKTTEAMHKRHTGHRREIEDQSTPLGRHFSKCGYANFSVQIIDCVKDGEDEAIFIIEGIWQNRLATFVQNGNINCRNELTRNSRSTAFSTFFDI